MDGPFEFGSLPPPNPPGPDAGPHAPTNPANVRTAKVFRMAGPSSKPEASSTYIYHREIIGPSTHNYGQ